MKQIQNVSLDGISFIVEREAHDILEAYLNKLKSHYDGNPNGDEIVEGIEGRIAELLLDEVGKDGVVTEVIATKVLDIVGKPEDIFGDSEQKPAEDGKSAIKKKLYRNPDDKLIAGVLGGIAAYFNFDSIWIRLGFSAVLIASMFLECDWFNPAIIALVYAVLWICMPKATTNQQKMEMCGKALSCQEIEKEVATGGQKKTSKISDAAEIIGKIFLIFFGAIIAFIGIIGIITISAVIFGLSIAGFSLSGIVADLMLFSDSTTQWMAVAFKVLNALVIFIPCILLLYEGIKLIFKFKSPKWKPGLIMLIIWLLSLVGLVGVTAKSTRGLWDESITENKEILESKIDSIGNTILEALPQFSKDEK